MPDDQEFPHLRFSREEQPQPRRRHGGGGVEPPDDPQAHAERLNAELAERVTAAASEVPGFDPRLLLKLEVELPDVGQLESIGGLSVVSQEGKAVTVIFASEEGLQLFQDRMNALQRGEKPTRVDILYAIRGIEGWSAADRTGPALSMNRPTAERLIVDVELWALDLTPDREAMIRNFESWCGRFGVELLDRVNKRAIILFRLRATQASLDELLNMRDVRRVDLPPSFQLGLAPIHADLSSLPAVTAPPSTAPGVVVLDSGLATAHPLLAPAVGDSQSFVDGMGPEDGNGHGTMVAGLALYGDVEECMVGSSFRPMLRLFSGRVTDDLAEGDQFIENRIENAVRYFKEHYACKVFNLSLGDARKPYTGGHVGNLAAFLDTISREQNVLFVVSAGNYSSPEQDPMDWRGGYPDYLLAEAARVLDPAPALNVLTVGSLARREASRMAQRFEDDPAHQPIARTGAPSPFSRSGPGACDAIKPELVEFGGNWAVDARVDPPHLLASAELGEVSTSRDFASGRLLASDNGTSLAGPKVAHLAARLLAAHPNASPSLLRALIVAHAEVPPETLAAVDDADRARMLVGYGRPRNPSSLYSTERRVTLMAEDQIEPNQCHFYSLPLPDDFFSAPARRPRRITISLAHSPRVRRTRIDYRECTVRFRVVRADDLDAVREVFRHGSTAKNIPEHDGFCPGPSLRDHGTVQAATWSISQVNRGFSPPFVVVTNQTPGWGPSTEAEPYALVAVVEDCSTQQVRFYTQIRELIRQRARERVRM